MERNKVLKEKLVLKKSVKRFINQVFYSIILLLIVLIGIKKNSSLKDVIKKNVYEDSIKFIKIKEVYNNYFGNLVPIASFIPKEEAVFNEEIIYNNIEEYKDGVKLSVNDNYLVPVLQEGIVVYIGEKDDYGKTVIVEQTDGVDVFYSNIKNVDVNLYDYVDKGDLIGEVDNNNLILVFQKEGNIIDYKKYI